MSKGCAEPLKSAALLQGGCRPSAGKSHGNENGDFRQRSRREMPEKNADDYDGIPAADSRIAYCSIISCLFFYQCLRHNVFPIPELRDNPHISSETRLNSGLPLSTTRFTFDEQPM
jgi:hypothetical protein